MAKPPPQKLADIHSLLRYVPWGKLLKAEDGETVLGLLGIAFELRAGEEYLSATWVEHFDNDPDLGNAAHQAVRAVRSSALKVTTKSGFTCGSISQIRSACADRSAKVRFLHEPAKDNPAHAALRHWPEDALLYDRLAERDWADWFLNKDVPS
jgi:hypothetical protein